MAAMTLDKIEWNPAFETGISEIDNQHKRIVKLVNTMQSAAVSNDAKAIDDVLTELTDYTVSHFTFEETIMAEAGYQFLGPHKKVHELFARKVTSYIERYREGENIAVELNNMLVKWLFNHITNEDRGYVQSINTYLNATSQENLNPQIDTVPPKQPGFWARLFGRFFS
jgi:hemerythrin